MGISKTFAMVHSFGAGSDTLTTAPECPHFSRFLDFGNFQKILQNSHATYVSGDPSRFQKWRARAGFKHLPLVIPNGLPGPERGESLHIA